MWMGLAHFVLWGVYFLGVLGLQTFWLPSIRIQLPALFFVTLLVTVVVNYVLLIVEWWVLRHSQEELEFLSPGVFWISQTLLWTLPSLSLFICWVNEVRVAIRTHCVRLRSIDTSVVPNPRRWSWKWALTIFCLYAVCWVVYLMALVYLIPYLFSMDGEPSDRLFQGDPWRPWLITLLMSGVIELILWTGLPALVFVGSANFIQTTGYLSSCVTSGLGLLALLLPSPFLPFASSVILIARLLVLLAVPWVHHSRQIGSWPKMLYTRGYDLLGDPLALDLDALYHPHSLNDKTPSLQAQWVWDRGTTPPVPILSSMITHHFFYTFLKTQGVDGYYDLYLDLTFALGSELTDLQLQEWSLDLVKTYLLPVGPRWIPLPHYLLLQLQQCTSSLLLKDILTELKLVVADLLIEHYFKSFEASPFWEKQKVGYR
jgi:hypothetical protein